MISNDLLWQQLSLLLFELDSEGRIVRASCYASKVLGPELESRSFQELLVDFHSSWNLDKLCDEQGCCHLLNLISATGLPQSFRLFCHRIPNGYLIVGEQDVQDAFLLQTQLVDLNNRMAEMTRELQKKNADLERLNELKNHFLGMAAHDLRSPLSVIVGYSEMMLQQKHLFTIPEFLELVSEIRNMSDFMLSMINDLLDISAIESGKLQLKTEPVDLNAWIEKSVQLNRVIADKRGNTISIVNHADRPICMADIPRLKQVLNNLLSNAIKFSPDNKEVLVTVDPDGDFIRVGVHDRGPGIPREEQDKLFNPFFKLSAKPASGESGTGLGLVICKKIVQQHKGKIWAESNDSGGASFYFTLPLCK